MKNIAVILVIIVLAVIVWVQYAKLKRLSPPEAYDYAFREDLDLDYHNPAVLHAYYTSGHEVGVFAREVWREEGVNVRIPESENSTSRKAVAHYTRLRAYTDSLGARLSRSYKLKQSGYSNADIVAMETEGVSPQLLKVRKTFASEYLVKGDKNPGVFELQARLLEKGYLMPHDGYYWSETEEAVKAYQRANKLFPSGSATQELLLHLIAHPGK